jgi:hypothetical protein
MRTYGVRNTVLTLALGLAAALALPGPHAATPADAQVRAPMGAKAKIKTGCPNVIVARCPKNHHRECSQTDSRGCCTKSACVYN